MVFIIYGIPYMGMLAKQNKYITIPIHAHKNTPTQTYAYINIYILGSIILNYLISLHNI